MISNIFLMDNGTQQEIIIFFHAIKVKNAILSTISHIRECEIQLHRLQKCTPDDLKTHCILVTLNDIQYICCIPEGSRGD